ncbi:synaptonemal complex protein 1-like [Rosa chinensis]|uniref:synaptonemal complex protein 1-like n=1 Tax=Rosa chinensis TaxID=74649 RepID=UPI001AD94685|nr:synaptonemal complex protein 1-like [Rosa chinensis]
MIKWPSSIDLQEDSPLVAASQTPVSTLLKKASENMNSPNVMNISKHQKKVIFYEYEVETGNGRTIKLKARSTDMFEV